VLLIGMVMLLMITLIAVGLIRMSTRHTQVVNNEQVRAEAVAATNYALDMVLNQPRTSWDVYVGAGKTEYVNMGTVQSADSAEVSVPVKVSALAMKRCRLIRKSELFKVVGKTNQVSAQDASCITGDSNDQVTIYDPTVLGSSTDKSYCATVLYELQAKPSTDAADDAKQLLNATVTTVQGVEVRDTADNVAKAGVPCD
jgi:glycerol-3-phosphate cytidylyltransferase-like family protein